MHTYGVFAYYRDTEINIKWTWAEPFKMKIEQELTFVVDDSRFLDAQEAKKVSKRTVD